VLDRAAQKGKAFGKSEKLGNTKDPNGDQLIGATTIAALMSGAVSHICKEPVDVSALFSSAFPQQTGENE